MQDKELLAEIERLKAQFINADENKINALSALIEQAAYETIYLKRINEKAITTGLVKIHPENPDIQKALPVSQEIARHSAALTNILDKLCKHLATASDEEELGLDEYGDE